MTQHAFLRFKHGIPQASPTVLASLLSIGLASLLPMAGCNGAPAPVAPATTTQAAPPPAAPPPAAGPAATGPVPAAPPAAAPAMAQSARERLAPAAPIAPRQYTVPVGTPLVVRVGQTISAKNSNVGDSFSGTLAQSVVVGGVSVIPAGAPVTGAVVASKGQGRFKGSGALGVALRRVGAYTVSTSAYESDLKGKGKRSAEFIGGGGGGGALIGGLAGGGKGALIGGLLGAGAGTAGAALTGNKDVTIPAESVVTFTLTQPITVTRDRGKS